MYPFDGIDESLSEITFIRLPPDEKQKEFNILLCKLLLAVTLLILCYWLFSTYSCFSTIKELENKVRMDYQAWFDDITQNYSCQRILNRPSVDMCGMMGGYNCNLTFNATVKQ